MPSWLSATWCERFKDRITEFAADFNSTLIFDCDVSSDEQIDKMFADLSQTWPTFDGFVHSIGFAPREAIAGDFLDGLSRENFRIAHDISAYSFPGMAKAALPYLNPKASLLTLSYLGALRIIPHYNTMGLAKASLEASVRYLAESFGPRGMRVNGISAGPIKTLAASGIKDFGKLLAVVAAASPTRRNVTIEEVGNVAAFLLSDLASGRDRRNHVRGRWLQSDRRHQPRQRTGRLIQPAASGSMQHTARPDLQRRHLLLALGGLITSWAEAGETPPALMLANVYRPRHRPLGLLAQRKIRRRARLLGWPAPAHPRWGRRFGRRPGSRQAGLRKPWTVNSGLVGGRFEEAVSTRAAATTRRGRVAAHAFHGVRPAPHTPACSANALLPTRRRCWH